MTNEPPLIEVVACFLLAATTVSMIWYVWKSYNADKRRAEVDDATYAPLECLDALANACVTVLNSKDSGIDWTLDDLLTTVEIALIHSKKGEIKHAENSTETDGE